MKNYIVSTIRVVVLFAFVSITTNCDNKTDKKKIFTTNVASTWFEGKQVYQSDIKQ